MSMPSAGHIPLWLVDTSTFIHACIIERVALMTLLRNPLVWPEYVLRWELGQKARPETRRWVEESLKQRKIGVRRLSLDDLDRIAQLNAPRRVGLGEMACAVVAEREKAGVLCDDRNAQRWLLARLRPVSWEAIEDVLLLAAEAGYISELDLQGDQTTLARNAYKCRCDL
jgi:predicted nucleic acid-binding protein